MGKWVHVDNGLPTESGEYLVNVHYDGRGEENDGDIVVLAWFNEQHANFPLFPREAGWTLLNEFYEYSDRLRENITHWMPLPEPPTGWED